MVAALALATIFAGPTSIDLTPSDDVWVYTHAGDNKDQYLRIWGSGGADVAASADDMESFAYSYLKFDLSKVPSGKLTGAKLTFTHAAGPVYSLEYATKNPLQVRPLSGDFDEKTWDFAKADKVAPEAGAKAIFGKGSPETLPAADKEFTIAVDLLKGPKSFAEYFEKAKSSATKTLPLALTTSMDVSDGRAIYKLFSKDCESATKRPVLHLTIEG